MCQRAETEGAEAEEAEGKAGAPLYVILKDILKLQTWLSLKRVAIEGFSLERELWGPRKTNLEATT